MSEEMRAEATTAETKVARTKKVFRASGNPKVSPANLKDFFERAKKSAPDNKGDQLYIELGSEKGGYTARVYTKSDMQPDSHIANIRAKEQVAEEHPVFGSLGSIEDLTKLVEGGYVAHIVGTFTASSVAIEVVETGVSSAKAAKESYKSAAKAEEERLVSEGILTLDEVNERKEYLKFIGIKEGSMLYMLVLKAIRRQPEGKTIRKPSTVYLPPADTKDNSPVVAALRHVAIGNNVVLQGPKSTGKDVLVETVGWLLNRWGSFCLCNGSMTIASAQGYNTTDESEKKRITEEGIRKLFEDFLAKREFSAEALDTLKSILLSMSPSLKMTLGPITEALMRANAGYGVVLVMDEMNLCDPNTLSGLLNAITDGHTQSMYIAGLGEVPINRENLTVMATQNSCGGDYLGTQVQNDATMSRFVCVDIKASPTIEPVLRSTGIEVEDEMYTALNAVYKKFFDLVARDEVSESCLNLRGMISALKVIALGEPFFDAVKECVINTTPNKDDWEVLEAELRLCDPS